MCAATLAAALDAFFLSFFFLFRSVLRVEVCDSVSVSVAEPGSETPYCVCSLSLSTPFMPPRLARASASLEPIDGG